MARHLIFSDAAINAVRPGDPRKRLNDSDGLYLLLFVEGGAHAWRFDYSFHGRRKTISLGTYPDTSLALARRKADQARQLVAEHIDPSQKRKAEKESWAQARIADAREAQGLPSIDSFEAVARVVRGQEGLLVAELWREDHRAAAAEAPCAPHLVPLPRKAVEVLRERHPLTGHAKMVFRGERLHDRAMSENTINAALRAMGFSADEVTGPGFRATARTMQQENLGFDPDVIEAQLAHVVRDPLGRACDSPRKPSDPPSSACRR